MADARKAGEGRQDDAGSGTDDAGRAGAADDGDEGRDRARDEAGRMRAEAERLEALAAERLGLRGVTVVDSLAGGVNGVCFVVAAAGRRYVVKRVETESRLIDLAEEFALLERLAAAGVAPHPVALDVDARLIATELMVDARPLTAAETREPANAARIAALLARLHGVAHGLPAFAPERYAATYLAGIGGVEALAPGERAHAEALQRLAGDFRVRFPGAVCCHNDLVAANIVEVGSELRLVDFEYAAAADPVLDLASVTVMNEFGAVEAARLVEAYYAAQPAPFSRPEFAKVQRLVALLTHFWARARAAAGDHRVDRFMGPYS